MLPINIFEYRLFNIFLTSSVLSSVIFFPIIYKLTHNIISPYGKANRIRRALASIVDISLFLLFFYFFLFYEKIYFLVFGCTYILFRDSLLQGKSVGKFLFGLMVIRLSDGKPCSLSQSILRNLFFIIPGMNIVAFIFEVYFSIKDKQGIRLGDKFAVTQVVEGKKVPELVKLFQIILSYFNFDNLAEEKSPQKGLAQEE